VGTGRCRGRRGTRARVGTRGRRLPVRERQHRNCIDLDRENLMNTRVSSVTKPSRVRNRQEFTLAQLKQARKRIDPHVVSLTAPDSYEAEQYRKLRYVLEQRHTPGDALMVGIGSPAPGDGKSLTALNLAGALAQDMGARILLV